MQEIIREILRQYWGYDSFRPLQEEIILSVLEGKDTLGLMPTGGGKSITFQVPTLAVEGMALVITPLIALMKDQVDNLKAKGIKAAFLHSGLSRREMITTLENCIYGRYKFLYISPERLGTDLFKDFIPHLPVSFIVVDEAHCISQWGYDFRPSYLKIAPVREAYPKAPVLALTATATREVIEEIQTLLQFREKNVFRKSFARPNLTYVVRKGEDKRQQMLRILERVPGSSIVYARNRKRTKEIALELRQYGIEADFYHAGLATEDKNEKQRRWTSGECRVMVATNAFGMGIDKPDVRTVIHIDTPSSPEEYYQEAGRAGRDGKRAYAVLLYSKTDKGSLHKRITESYPSKEFILQVYEALGNYLNIAIGCGYNELYEFDLKKFCEIFSLPVAQTVSALKILTQAGQIEYIEEIDTQARIMVLVKKEELYNLPDCTEQTDRVLQCLLRSYTGLFADYVFIREEMLAERLQMTPQQIYESLIALTKRHILHYIPRKRTPYIIYTSRREEPKYITIPHRVYEERKKRFEHRIESMIRYATDEECRSRMLLEYFDEKSDECGCCDVCIERRNGETLTADRFKTLARTIQDMLAQRPASRQEIVQALPYPQPQVIETLRYLQDEGYIREENRKFRNTKK